MSRLFSPLLLVLLALVVVASSTACAYHKSRTPVAGRVIVERKTPLYQHETRTYHRSGYVAAPPPRHTPRDDAQEVRDRADAAFDDLREVTGGYHGEVVAVDAVSGNLLFNLGSEHGVRTGMVYTARNPDSYEFSGEAHVVDVQPTSSMARVTFQTARGICIGDIIQPRRDPKPVSPTVCMACPSEPVEQVCDDEDQGLKEIVHEPKRERPSRVLTRRNVIDMATAGISETNIRLLIQRSWVDFDVDSDTMIEFKRVGLSDELLEALILRLDEQEEFYE